MTPSPWARRYADGCPGEYLARWSSQFRRRDAGSAAPSGRRVRARRRLAGPDELRIEGAGGIIDYG